MGPFNVKIVGGMAGTIDAEIYYENTMVFDESTSAGYWIPTFTERVNGNPQIDFGGYIYAGVEMDFLFGGGSVGIDADLDLIHLQFPVNGHYTFNPESYDIPNPLPGFDLLQSAGAVDWNVDWHIDAKLILTMMRGRIDLVVQGWVRFFWKKMKKTWRKNITTWDGKEKANKELFNLGDSMTLLTTPDIFTLLDTKPSEGPPTQTELRNLENTPIGRSYKSVDAIEYDINKILDGQEWWDDDPTNAYICAPIPI